MSYDVLEKQINLLTTEQQQEVFIRNQKDFRSHIVATQTPKAFLQEQEA